MMQMQQQMMGKAGGAAPQQGLGAMNPMAAMMGGLLAASQWVVHAVEDFLSSDLRGMGNMAARTASPPRAPEKEIVSAEKSLPSSNPLALCREGSDKVRLQACQGAS